MKYNNLYYMLLIVFYLNHSDSSASDVKYEQPTQAKGLARSTLDPVVSSFPGKFEENNDRSHYHPNSRESSYNIHGQVIALFKLGENEVEIHGLGTLIGPRHVLTFGQNIYQHQFSFVSESLEIEPFLLNKWAKSVTFVPFLKEGKSDLRTSAHTLLCPTQWVKAGDSLFDYGMILLEKPLGETIGWAGLLSANDKEFQDFSEIAATFIKETADLEKISLNSVDCTLNHITNSEISCFSKLPIDQCRDLILLSNDSSILGLRKFGKNNISQDDRNKVFRITPLVFHDIMAWLSGNYPSVNQEIIFKTYKKKANESNNDPQAQFDLAECYQARKQIKKNSLDKALEWYLKFCANENASKEVLSQANEKVADLFYSKKDYNKAIAFYKASNEPFSLYRIVEIYLEKEKEDKAYSWLKKAIDEQYQKEKILLNKREEDPFNFSNFGLFDCLSNRTLFNILEFFDYKGGLTLKEVNKRFNFLVTRYYSKFWPNLEIIKELNIKYNQPFLLDKNKGIRDSLAKALEINLRPKELVLNDVKLDDEDITLISLALAKNMTLTLLSLSHNNIRDLGAAKLGSMLALNTNLTTLNLSHNEIKVAGFNLLSFGLSRNTSLQTLNLAFNKLSEAQEEFSRLQKLSLQELNIGGNHLETDALNSLASALGKNTSLTALSLTHSGLNDDNFDKIIECLLSPESRLKSLDVSFNALANGAAFTLSAYLDDTRQLTSLDLGHNKITETGIQDLIEVLKKQKNVTSLKFLPNDTISHETSLTLETLVQTLAKASREPTSFVIKQPLMIPQISSSQLINQENL